MATQSDINQKAGAFSAKGGANVTNNLAQFINKQEIKAAATVIKCTILIATEASYLTPIDTSTLLNSQYRSVSKEGAKIKGVIGYSSDYAGYVHDPAVKQVFVRDSAEKEFLLKGAERARQLIDKVIKQDMKV